MSEPSVTALEKARTAVAAAEALVLRALQEITSAREDVTRAMSDIGIIPRVEQYDIIDAIVPLLRGRGVPMSDADIAEGVAQEAQAHGISIENISRSLKYNSRQAPRSDQPSPLVCVTDGNGKWKETDPRPARDIARKGLPGDLFMLREQYESQK